MESEMEKNVISSKMPPLVISLVFFLFFTSTTSVTEAFDALDPNGNITIRWDIMQWTPDGYVAVVTIFNFQEYRNIQEPGWSLGWTWDKKEVIWSIVGARATEKGNCSRFKGDIPYSCRHNPTIVDLLPGAPYNMQIANCCKGGVISSWMQDPANAASSFQLSVGLAGNTNRTVRLPKNFTLKAPGPGYTCGPAKVGKPTRFITADGRRVTQALMSWKVTCVYSEFLAHKTPTCCVSLSSFYNDTIVNCPTCSCSCQNKTAQPGNCIKSDSPSSALVSNGHGNSAFTPLVECTSHMCPIRVHWHVKLNKKKYWVAKISINNLNYRMSYTGWNVVVQNPYFDNHTEVFSFNYKPLTVYGETKGTAMLWRDEVLQKAGNHGNVMESEILFNKDASKFTLGKGWAFPRRVYVNGDNCVLPSPEAYPYVPNRSLGH